MQKLERPSIEFYFGAAITLFSAVVPMTWWLRLLFLAVVAGILLDLVWRSPVTAHWKWTRKAPLAVVGIALLAATSWRSVRDDFVGQKLPDVSMRLVHPKRPSLQLQNVSNKVARQIKYQVTLWNLDAIDNPKNPLQIPTGTFDFIRAGNDGGPQDIFQNVESALKQGNKLFGSIGISCPDCIRGRTFWVYISWQEGGWFYEVPDIQTGGVLVPKDMEHTDMRAFAAAMIAAIPENQRTAIGR